MGSDDGLIDHLTLVRDRQTVLRGQLTELFMGEAHDYRMRMIIKRRGTMSTEIFPVTSKRAATPDSGSATTYRRGKPLLGWNEVKLVKSAGRAKKPMNTGKRNGRHEETRTPDLYRVKVAL